VNPGVGVRVVVLHILLDTVSTNVNLISSKYFLLEWLAAPQLIQAFKGSIPQTFGISDSTIIAHLDDSQIPLPFVTMEQRKWKKERLEEKFELTIENERKL